MTRGGDDAERESDVGAPPACGGEERRRWPAAATMHREAMWGHLPLAGERSGADDHGGNTAERS
jgi:hypothetical protein